MDALIFLTSTSDSVPSGRNARAAARASVVRKSVRPSARGTFGVFGASHTHELKDVSQKRLSQTSLDGSRSKHSSISKVLKQQRERGIPRALGYQSIVIGELLATATTIIRRDLNLILKKQPSRVRDLIRRRLWAAAAFAVGDLPLTPEVYSAVKYLEHKLLKRNQSEQSHAIELRKYGVALSELQRSLRDPECRMQPGVLAASHILAICEMLDDAGSCAYLKFVDGILSLSNLQARNGDEATRLHLLARVGAILVEALLTRPFDATLNQPWSKTLTCAGYHGHLSEKDAFSFADSADLIFSGPSWTYKSMTSKMTEKEKSETLAKARSLHSDLKLSIEDDMLHSNRAKSSCPLADIISERVAVMIALEDLISNLATRGNEHSQPMGDDFSSFYAHAISLE